MKNCPFCGELPDVFRHDGSLVCRTEGCPIAGQCFSPEKWNTRVPDLITEDLAVALREALSNCGCDAMVSDARASRWRAVLRRYEKEKKG